MERAHAYAREELRELRKLYFEVAHAYRVVERAKTMIDAYRDELVDADVNLVAALDAALDALDALETVKHALKTIITRLATHANPADEHDHGQPRNPQGQTAKTTRTNHENHAANTRLS